MKKIGIIIVLVLLVTKLFSQDFPKTNFNEIDLLKYVDLNSVDRLKDLGHGFFMHERIQIDGFSKTGKVAYIINIGIDGRGGSITTAYVFDFINDKVVYKNAIDDFDFIYQGRHYQYYNENYNESSYTNAYNLAYRLFLQNYNKICKQNNIEFIPVEFNRLPIRFNTQLINITIEKNRINKIFEDEPWRNDNTLQYKIFAENRGRRKILKTGEEFSYDLFVCGYFMSPFENRALVIIGIVYPDWEFYPEVYYIFTGCHLTNGFM
jgi:hypothetical protein